MANHRRDSHRCLSAVLFPLLIVSSAPAQTRWRAAANLDQIVQQAVRENQIPGAVLVVGQHGKILHRKAYGNRSLVPQREAMTLDTIFDCASRSKYTRVFRQTSRSTFEIGASSRRS